MGDLDWTEDGAPRSRRFDDVYFSREDGLAESRAVFLAGCGLPEAWAGRERFVVAELGFGTGLNVLALLELWRRTRPPGGRLHAVSAEAFPLRRDEAARALAAWPELADLAAPLLARWPRALGVHRFDWSELSATLDVVVGDVSAVLAAWDGRADAWFLDGFAPSRNPEMWSETVLAAVAARSAPGARLATFTVAGAVRRGLEAVGFAVERRPGHGRKRQRLEARLIVEPSAAAPGSPSLTRPPTRDGEVLVVGGGIAAASLVRALRAEGRGVRLLAGPGRGASGNPAALVSPRLELGDTSAARLHAQAFRRAVDLYADTLGAILSGGVRQLGDADQRDRFERLAGSPLYAEGSLDFEEGPDGPALLATEALVVDPRRLVDAWLDGVERLMGTVARLEPTADGWAALDGEETVLAESPHMALAVGAGLTALAAEPTLRDVRGQVSWAPGVDGPAATWGGYCAPSPAGLLFGATHDRDDPGEDLRAADHARNLATLRARFPEIADQAARAPLEGRAAVRATTPDRLPVAGPAPDPTGEARPGLWLLGGLGSRGFTTAPLLAEHVAAGITGAPSPLPEPLGEAVHPGRFRLRALRRGRMSPDPLS